MIAAFQVLPTSTGTAVYCWTHVGAAIAVVLFDAPGCTPTLAELTEPHRVAGG